MLYFAYGANLNLENMKLRCPKAKPIMSFTLPNYRLVFKGVADIEPSFGNSVQGVIWNITQDCEDALDRFEGYPFLYGKDSFTVKTTGKFAKDFGKYVDIMFYKMNRQHYGPPSKGYWSCLHEGYLDNDLDTQFLFDALEHSIQEHSPLKYSSKSWS